VRSMEGSIWIPLEAAVGNELRAGYRRFRLLFSPDPIWVTKVVARVVRLAMELPPKIEGREGLLVSGLLYPLADGGAWTCRLGEREWQGGVAGEEPLEDALSGFVPTSEWRGEALRMAGAGLANVQAEWIGRSFKIQADAFFGRNLAAGFHPVEFDPRGAFRWSQPGSRLRLPAQASPAAYRLTVQVEGSGFGGSNRVALACGEQSKIFWVSNALATLEWDVEAQAGRNGLAEIGIEADPWTPADHGSRDARVLGVLWYGAKWERIDEEEAK
jgi:hypothetical protein